MYSDITPQRAEEIAHGLSTGKCVLCGVDASGAQEELCDCGKYLPFWVLNFKPDTMAILHLMGFYRLKDFESLNYRQVMSIKPLSLSEKGLILCALDCNGGKLRNE